MPTDTQRAHRPTGALALCVLLTLTSIGQHAAAQLIPGIEEWAEQAAVESQAKWVGPRVAFPNPTKRPQAAAHLTSQLRPLAVHFDAARDEARARAVLSALEAAYDVLAVTGFTEGFGDLGAGKTTGHDVYLVSNSSEPVAIGVDATEPFRGLDGVRAFALLDTRLPDAHVAACATDALLQTYLYELDPAEAETVRKSSAAYLTSLVTGSMGCDAEAERAAESLSNVPFAPGTGASGATWLAALDGRETGHTGVFLREMWQFARQRTWEGAGLRASPDLIEAIAKALSFSREKLDDVAGELALDRALALRPHWERASASSDPALSIVRFDELPEHLPAPLVPPGPLASSYALLRIDPPSAGVTLKVWSRGELGVRWSLQAMRLDREGRVLSRVRAPTRDDPARFLLVDLDANTHEVLIAVTHLSDGTPDPDEVRAADERNVVLILDR